MPHSGVGPAPYSRPHDDSASGSFRPPDIPSLRPPVCISCELGRQERSFRFAPSEYLGVMRCAQPLPGCQTRSISQSAYIPRTLGSLRPALWFGGVSIVSGISRQQTYFVLDLFSVRSRAAGATAIAPASHWFPAGSWILFRAASACARSTMAEPRMFSRSAGVHPLSQTASTSGDSCQLRRCYSGKRSMASQPNRMRDRLI